MDLNQVAQSNKYNVRIESIIPENAEDAKLRRKKDFLMFGSFLIAFFVLLIVCIILLFTKPALESAALSTLTGLVSALAGYYVRGKSY